MAIVIPSLEKPHKSKKTDAARTAQSERADKAIGPVPAPPADPIAPIAARTLAHGGKVDLDRFVGPAPARPLPQYPWQNKPFCTDTTTEGIHSFSGRHWPLLGFRLRSEASEWYSVLDADALPYLADHKVEETIVFPAAGYVEMALRAARLWFETEAVELRDLDILRPLVFEEGRSQQVRVRISPDDRVIEIESRARLEDAEWSLHARGTMARPPKTGGAPRLDEAAAERTASMS
ncbi:polyketide synthase dehydratase domain-containing protein [Breoghania sp.]|uniref:polyketide synthase dehydratase domain-containing protein n=1 Tax=Breoghania sp. TaxID=2065378 RepID=UPI002617DB53|nr:polyketide synthase dehydratase domain-containing protein [Breoghania sp.]MDJ0932173.1 polyketide synthase dehydratase domain-containing protein [Breoghania sp.]